jgi:hypothetical protein
MGILLWLCLCILMCIACCVIRRRQSKRSMRRGIYARHESQMGSRI